MVRRYQPGDGAALAALWSRYIETSTVTFTTTRKTEADIAAIAAEGALWVAERGGAPVGLARLTPFRAGPGYAATAEVTLLLSPSATGQGLGPALLQRAEASAREAGRHALIAGISGENAGAVRFFGREGYRMVGRLPEVGQKFGRWLDLLLFQKTL